MISCSMRHGSCEAVSRIKIELWAEGDLAVYALYRRTKIGDRATHYEWDKSEREISFFGRNNGFIPWLPRGFVRAYLDAEGPITNSSISLGL